MTQQVFSEYELSAGIAEAMERGRECIKFRKWDEAVQEFRRAARIDPDSAEVRHLLAHAYSVSDPDFSTRCERSVDAAIEEYKKAIKLNPDFALSHARLANLYHVHKGMIDESIVEYEKAIDLGGLDAEDEFIIHNNLGFIYRDKGMYEEALRCFLKAIYLKPHNSYILWKIAALYAVQGNARKSVAFLKRAIESGENPGRIRNASGWFDKIRNTKEFQDFMRSLER